MWTLLLLLVILAMAFSVPAWPDNRSWGFYPSAGLGALLLALVLFMFLRPI